MGMNRDNIETFTQPLWSHQRKALLEAKNYHALFFDPGCGKSRTAIELYNRIQGFPKILIVAPLNVCRNWLNELEKFLAVKYEARVAAGQTKAKKLAAIAEFCNSDTEDKGITQVLIVNTESFRAKEYKAAIACSNAKFVIVDESHNFKGPASQQTKGLMEVLEVLNPRHLYLLTGTPAPQGELDLWSTFKLLKVTQENYFVWRKRYFEDKNIRRLNTKGYFPDWVIRPSAKEEFRKLLESCSITARKNEVLDLPPLLQTNVYCELSPEQRKHYDTMEEFLFAVDDEGNELNAANVLSRTLRLQQIIAGIIGDGFIKDNPRLKALEYAIEQTNGEQFIIWTIFRPTYKQLGEFLDERGITFGMLTGEQSAEERNQTMQAFQAGKIRALIANPKAGGVGVNLTAASYAIYYTKGYNLVDDDQSQARNYRGGSEIHKRITRIDIIAEDTIDEEIADALRRKAAVQDFILGLKKRKEIKNGQHKRQRTSKSHCESSRA